MVITTKRVKYRYVTTRVPYKRMASRFGNVLNILWLMSKKVGCCLAPGGNFTRFLL